MILRDYQNAAINSIFEYFYQKQGHPILAMPPGTGKSVVIGEFSRKVCRQWPNQRIVMLTHVMELIEQNFEKLLLQWPTAPAGIYSAGMKRSDSSSQIVYCGIASVFRRAREIGWIDLILIDECHLVSPAGMTMYAQFITESMLINPYLKVVGLSATPYRIGQGLLTDGGLFTDICYDITRMAQFNRLIDEGWLCRLNARPTDTQFDTSEVPIVGGDFNQKALQATVDKPDITRKAVAELVDLSQHRAHWLVFGSGIEHCHHISAELNRHGIRNAVLTNNTKPIERREIIAQHKSGQLRALVNNNILTTGYDNPAIDCIGMLRSTMSTVLWIQMLGRGIRPVYLRGATLDTAEQRRAAILGGPKPGCLVLDFCGNTERLGPINDPIIPKRPGKKRKGSRAPTKACETCGYYAHASARVCLECGADFDIRLKLLTQASTAELMRSEFPVVEDFAVHHVAYSYHPKSGKPPTLRVCYSSGLRRFNEYICLEHLGTPLFKAHDFWNTARPPDAAPAAPPRSVHDALARINEIRPPRLIRVWINKEHPEVMSRVY